MAVGDTIKLRSDGSWELPTSEDTWEGVEFSDAVGTPDSIYDVGTPGNDIDIQIDETGYYLAIFRVRYDGAADNRNIGAVRAMFDGTEIVGTRMANFYRQNEDDEVCASSFALFEVSTTGDYFRVEFMNKGEDSTPAEIASVSSEVCLIKFADYNGGSPAIAFSHYTEGTDTAAYSTEGNPMFDDTPVLETDTDVIEIDGVANTNVTLKKEARYLVGYNITFEGTARAGRISWAELDGTEIPHSHSYCYLRDADTDYETLNALFIIDVGDTDPDLTLHVAATNCSTTGARCATAGWDSSLIVIELPASAEVVIGYDATGAQETSVTTPGLLNACRTTPVIDSASFTRNDNTTIEVEKADDYLFMVGARINRASSTGTRSVHLLRWLKNNIDQEEISSKYMRGLQSSTYTYEASFNGAFMANLAVDDEIEFEFQRPSGGSSGLGQTIAGSVGMSALNIGTLAEVSSSSSSLSSSSSRSSSSSSSSLSSSSSSFSVAAGTWCWGHDTGVEEDFTGDIADGSGTAQVVGVGDDELVCVEAAENWVFPSVNTGAIEIELAYDQYDTGSGVPGTIEYRTGASKAACEAAGWTGYTGHFSSLGWVQVRISKA